MKSYFIITLLIIVGCIPSENANINSKVSSDTSYQGRAKFDGAFPSVNTLMASSKTPSGNYYYGAQNEADSVYHRVSILNPSNEPTTLSWLIDGTAIPGSDSKSLTVFPDLFGDVTTLSGDHTIEVKLMDGNGTTLDSRTWLIHFTNRADDYTNVSISGESPASSITYAYSMATDKEVSFSATINDPSSEGYYYKWYVDDVLVNDPGPNASTSATFTFISERYEVGLHTLTLRVRNQLYETYFAEVSWGINLMN